MNKNQNHNQNIGTNDIFYRPPYTMNGTDDQCPGTAVCQQPRKGTSKNAVTSMLETIFVGDQFMMLMTNNWLPV